MKKIDRVMSILPAVLLLLTLSTDAVGWDDRIQTDETINKYLKVNDKNGTDGLKDIESAIKGPDANQREDALEAMGCRFDYNSYKSSMGGFAVGDGGLSKADAQKLIDAILKKVKFWTNKTDKEDAAMAVLNMRARVKAAGL